MLKIDWIVKAEEKLETIRKVAETERDRIRKEFPTWPENDVRRWAVSRFATMLFLPVLGLYIMRAHLSEPAWWEHYATGCGDLLLQPGRDEFDRTVKGKLIIDLVGNLEHSFRVILRRLDPASKASDFSALCNSLLRANDPYLKAIPVDWQAPVDLLRRVRNTVHNAWMYFPKNGKNASVVYKGKTFELIVGKPIDFISWDLLCDIADDVLKIILAVVGDENVKSISDIPDQAAGTPLK